MKHITTTWLLGLGLWAAIGLAQGADRFSYSSDGSEVTDSSTGLTWKRCVEGMIWSGTTCVNTANKYKHEDALKLAQTQTGWRLPNVKELFSIADLSRSQPAIDTTAFPSTPTKPFWSSTYSTYTDNPLYVTFYDGTVDGSYPRSYTYYVRLVK